MLVATRSVGKMRELRRLFLEAGVEPLSLDEAGIPESPLENALESGLTFEANALAKVRHFQRLSGLPAVADDSGLEVWTLGGAPGIHSKRWSGGTQRAGPALDGPGLDAANNALLLQLLHGAADRRARYVCAAAYRDARREFVERGETEGHITVAARGREGFGYDPYFESVELACTFGEASPAAKAQVSHRARAFAKLLRRLQKTDA